MTPYGATAWVILLCVLLLVVCALAGWREYTFLKRESELVEELRDRETVQQETLQDSLSMAEALHRIAASTEAPDTGWTVAALRHVAEQALDPRTVFQLDDGTELAERLYRRYVAHAGGKNYAGLPCPQWRDLPHAVREHWRSTAEYAWQVFELQDLADSLAEDES